MGCLSIVASSFCSSIDIIGFCTTASMQIQLNHRPSASKQHNSNRIMGKIGIEPIMFTARERIYSPPQHRQSLPLSHNPDSRVSKVFIVLCLPRVVSGACPPIYLLQGGAYCLYDRIDSNDTCRELHPLFNLMRLVLAKHCIFY